jgi:hypothetical protein
LARTPGAAIDEREDLLAGARGALLRVFGFVPGRRTGADVHDTGSGSLPCTTASAAAMRAFIAELRQELLLPVQAPPRALDSGVGGSRVDARLIMRSQVTNFCGSSGSNRLA